jgi:hypothetical protein
VRFAVNEPAPRPVAMRGAGGVHPHRPPDAAGAGRVPLAYDGPPEVHLGAFTERLLVEHVSERRPRRGLGRWLRRAVRTPAGERRLPPGPGVRALTASGR